MFLTFSNTILLIGLAGAVVPLLLHLLSRTRYQTVDWGAMIFLEGMEARQQYTAKLNSAMLLGLRMAVVGLVAIALAQPVLEHWPVEQSSAVDALRAADRGRIFCSAGAIVFAMGTFALGLLAFTSIRQSGWKLKQAAIVLAAIVAGVVSIASGRRALDWQTKFVEMQARHPAESQSASGANGSAPRVDAAIVLDCSPSMEFEENGHTRLSIAQGAAKQVLAGLHRGDRAALVLLGLRQPESEMQPTADLQSVADRIDAAHTGHEPADVIGALTRAEEALERDRGAAARDFYIVCDRQASIWRGADRAFRIRWDESLRKSGASGRIFVVFAGNTDVDNVAVESVDLAEAPAILGQPANVVVGIRNYGGSSRAALPLSISVDGNPEFQTTVTVPAGGTVHVPAPIRGSAFPTAGTHVINAEIKTTGFREDDRFESVVDVIDPIRVLIISGDDWGTELGKFRNESDFLRLALAPLHTLARQGADPCKVEVVSDEKWPDDLQQYQVIVLANVERFSDARALAIEQYVYGGGGLLVAPGSLTRVENYNDQLWRDGGGILPAELEDATSADGTDATAIVGYDSSSPVFQFLHERPDLMLFPTIGRYFPTTPRSSEARAVAWYTSGAPFLLESAGGRGRVLLMTTSLDADWSTLPLSSFYLPYVQSAVRYLAAGTLPSHNLAPGEPIRLSVDEPVTEPASMLTPDGNSRPVEKKQNGQVSELQFDGTQEPGTYYLKFNGASGQRTEAFAVRRPTEGSDLSQLSDQQWTQLENDLHLKRIDPADRPIAAVVSGDREGYDLAPWALAIALLAGTLELVLARESFVSDKPGFVTSRVTRET
jgi:hypothetical protein